MAKKDEWNIVDLEDDGYQGGDEDYGDQNDGYQGGDEDYGDQNDGYQGGDEDYQDEGDALPRDGAREGRRGGKRGTSGSDGTGKKGRTVGSLLIVIGVLCLIAGGVVLVKNHMDTRKVQEQMEVLRSQVELDASRQAADEASRQAGQDTGSSSQEAAGEQQGSGNQSSQAGEGSQGEAASQETARVPNPYADSFRQNTDMAAWLKIEGTKIDYPVMQTMEDENYYLKRGFDKKSNQNGCLILDTDSTITGELSTNQIIHGHNMKSGEMFGTLTKFEDKGYCEEHKYISLYTEECRRNYEIIAVFRSQVYKKTDEVFKFYKFFQANTQEEFDDWYDNIKALSQFDTGVTAEFGDRFLTLSTCVYHVENGRLVVVAKEIEPGDYYEPVE